jgi:hypothetical protein
VGTLRTRARALCVLPFDGAAHRRFLVSRRHTGCRNRTHGLDKCAVADSGDVSAEIAGRRHTTRSSYRSPPGGGALTGTRLIRLPASLCIIVSPFASLSARSRLGRTTPVGLKLRSRNAIHRASEYPIGRLLSGSWYRFPTIPNASARTIAPSASSLELRDAPIVTFHVAIGAFYQTRHEPAPLTFRNRRLLSIRQARFCCRRNPKRKQNHPNYSKGQYRGSSLAA